MKHWAIFIIALVLAGCGDTGCIIKEVKYYESGKYKTCFEEQCGTNGTIYRTCRD